MIRVQTGIGVLLAALLWPAVGFSGPVNINAADAQTLAAELEGIGLARAQAIVAYRQAHGPFRKAEDLLAVKGVGERILLANKGNILIASDQRGLKETD